MRRWERLEHRILLARDIVISELMAANVNTIRDEDGDSSDWIEVQNVSTEPVRLAGWHLTDDPRRLTRWRFPDIEVAPGEHRMIFASGKDRTEPAAPLHSNFKLDRDGEYLALVRPDGRTIEDELQPLFPEQSQDISYGRGAPMAQTLVGTQSRFQIWVPVDGSYDAVGSQPPPWTQIGFDASGWTDAPAGFGFDTQTTQANVITPFRVDLDAAGQTIAGSLTNLINQPDRFLSPLPISMATTHTAAMENVGSWASGVPATLRFDLVFPTSFDHLLLWNYSFFDPVAGRDVQQESGTKDFAVSFSSDGVNYSDEMLFATRAPTIGQPLSVEQFALGSQTARFVRIRQISSHGGPVFGLGEIAFARGRLIDLDTIYDQDFVATDLKSSMHDAHRTSLYVRTTFDVADPESVTELAVRMRYDDGFIAYLNGVEVARSNAPASASWSSSAAAMRENRDAVQFVPFDVGAHRALLRATGNVLAVHGLNALNGSADFLLHPELVAMAADPVRFGFLETPTPGQPNSLRRGSAVAFSHPGGILASPVDVRLSVDNAYDAIHFTLDGKDPDLNSPRYESPIRVSQSMQIRARAFTPSGVAGPVSGLGFLKLGSDLEGFSSNLPIFIVDTFGKGLPSCGSPNLAGTYAAVFDIGETTGRSTLGSQPDQFLRAGMRVRGRATCGLPKKQYKFETWNDAGQDLDVSLLGLPAESDWVLYGDTTEKSLMRNVVTYQWWEELGYYSPRTRFVELFLNTNGGPELTRADDYLGVYVLIEGIKRGDDRVDIQPPEETTDISQITGGYIIEMGNADSQDFSTRASGRNVAYRYNDPRREELNTAQRDWVKNLITEFETALYSPDFRHPQTGKHYTEYIDVPSFIDYRLMREFTRNFDGGSSYFSIDRGGKMTMGPLWDYNWALGNVNYAEPSGTRECGCHTEGWNMSFTANVNGWAPWWRRLDEDPDHWQLLIDRWHQLRKSTLADAAFLADIDAHYRLLSAEAADRNFARWRILGQFTVISPAGWRERNTYEKEVNYLKDWLVQRAAWMDSQFTPAPAFSHPGSTVPRGFQLELTSPVVNGERLPIYYTTDGTDPRLPGGQISPQAVVYTGPITINTDVQIRARTRNATSWSAVETAQFVTAFPVGDSNLDGVFNSADLVRVFQAGHYEDAIPKNSSWADGDWNGDREFDTRDLVLAFQSGSYAAQAVAAPNEADRNMADVASAVDPRDAVPPMAQTTHHEQVGPLDAQHRGALPSRPAAALIRIATLNKTFTSEPRRLISSGSKPHGIDPRIVDHVLSREGNPFMPETDWQSSSLRRAV